MIIAVASGKGGTGKTTVATNLAAALAMPGQPVTYVDCDVEEPNGHIFLAPTFEARSEVTVPVPEVDQERCTSCGACRAACRFSAIMVFPRRVMVFPKLCHGCGGCQLACPEQAIREVPRPIGVIETGTAGAVDFVHGRLEIGEAMAPPLIREVLRAVPGTGTVIVDAPPGTSCPVIESIRPADVVVLVTEPTPFGVNDLALAVAMVRELGRPFGVVINRAGSGDRTVYEYCEAQQIPILLEIPDDLEIARAYSRGDLAVSVRPELAPGLRALHRRASRLAGRGMVVRRSSPLAGPPPIESSVVPPTALLPEGVQPSGTELAVISGKGGTGKTSVAAALATLAESVSIADCDVDAADLHLVLDPEVRGRWPFSGGHHAAVDTERCFGCGVCQDHCRFDAIEFDEEQEVFRIDPIACEGCGVCADMCPEEAIALLPSDSGQWMVSTTRHGPMVHARLHIAQENSGKLVSLVRRENNALATQRDLELSIVDGSPGIGCAVIASVTGAALALVVTEPTRSGLHDLERVAELTRQLGVQTAVCINKHDINPELAIEIEATAARLGLPVVGRIRYDRAVTAAQVQRQTVVEAGDSPAARDVHDLWQQIRRLLPDRRDRDRVTEQPRLSGAG